MAPTLTDEPPDVLPDEPPDIQKPADRRAILAHDFYQRGLDALSSGDVSTAAAHWQRSLQVDSTNTFAQNGLMRLRKALSAPSAVPGKETMAQIPDEPPDILSDEPPDVPVEQIQQPPKIEVPTFSHYLAQNVAAAAAHLAQFANPISSTGQPPLTPSPEMLAHPEIPVGPRFQEIPPAQQTLSSKASRVLQGILPTAPQDIIAQAENLVKSPLNIVRHGIEAVGAAENLPLKMPGSSKQSIAQGADTVRRALADALSTTAGPNGEKTVVTPEHIQKLAAQTGQIPYREITQRVIGESLAEMVPITPSEIASFAAAPEAINAVGGVVLGEAASKLLTRELSFPSKDASKLAVDAIESGVNVYLKGGTAAQFRAEAYNSFARGAEEAMKSAQEALGRAAGGPKAETTALGAPDRPQGTTITIPSKLALWFDDVYSRVTKALGLEAPPSSIEMGKVIEAPPPEPIRPAETPPATGAPSAPTPANAGPLEPTPPAGRPRYTAQDVQELAKSLFNQAKGQRHELTALQEFVVAQGGIAPYAKNTVTGKTPMTEEYADLAPRFHGTVPPEKMAQMAKNAGKLTEPSDTALYRELASYKKKAGWFGGMSKYGAMAEQQLREGTYIDPNSPQGKWENALPEADWQRLIKAERQVSTGPNSLDVNSIPAGEMSDVPPQLTPQRQKVWKKIIESPKYNAQQTFWKPGDPQPTAYLVIGPPGSGKSAAISSLAPKGTTLLDNDQIKAALPDWNRHMAEKFQDEGKQIAARVREQFILRGQSFIEPQIGRNEERLRALIQKLKESGYRVELSLVNASPEVSATRSWERYKAGGRFIKPSFIFNDVGLKPSEIYDKLKGEVNAHARFEQAPGGGIAPVGAEGQNQPGRPGGRDVASPNAQPPQQENGPGVAPSLGAPSAAESPGLFDVGKDPFDVQFKRFFDEAQAQGLSPVDAKYHALKRMEEAAKSAAVTPPTKEPVKQTELATPGGIESFGRGSKTQPELLSPRAPRVSGGQASQGGKPVSAFEPREPQPTTPETMQMSDEVKALFKKYAGNVGESNTPRTALGVFFPRTTNIQLRGLNDLSVGVHEITHYIDALHKITDPLLRVIGKAKNGNPIYDPATRQMRKELSEIYVEYYGSITDPLKKRMTEGLAVLIQKMAESPQLIKQKYPGLVSAFLWEGGRYSHARVRELLKDVHGIVGRYQKLSPLERIGSQMTNKVGQEGLKDSFLNFWQKFLTEIEDQLRPMKVLARQAGVEGTVKDPTLWTRQYQDASSLILNNITDNERGLWMLAGNEFKKVAEKNIGALVAEVKKAGMTDTFSKWLIARRVHFDYLRLDKLKSAADVARPQLERLLKAAGEDSLAAIALKKDIEELRAIVKAHDDLNTVLKNDGFSRQDATVAYEGMKDAFKGFADSYDAITRAHINTLRGVGLINADQAAEYLSNEGYTSFKRDVYDEIIGGAEGEIPSRVARTKVSAMTSRTGSRRDIYNPLYSLVQDHAEIMRKVMRQKVYNSLLPMSENLPDVFQRLPLEPTKDARTGRISFPQEKDPNIIMARDANGKRVPLLASAELKRVIDGVMTYRDVHIVEKIMTKASRIFTRGTTGTYIPFAAQNIIIDPLSALSQSQNKLNPIYDALAQITKRLASSNSPEAVFSREYDILRGERQTLAGWQDMGPDELIRTISGEKNKLLKFLDHLDQGLSILSWPAQQSEILTRKAEYIKARLAGKPQVVALEEAGSVTAPFHHIGRWGGPLGQSIVRGISFMNPAIEAMAESLRAFKNPITRNRAIFVFAAIAAAMVGSSYYLLKDGTEKQKKLYENLDANELARYIWYPAPNGKDLIRIRVPELVGSFATVLNMAIAEMIGNPNYTGKDFFDTATSFIPNQLNPIDLKRWVFSMILQIVKPAILTAANTKDFPRPHPLVGQRLERLPPAQQSYPSTPDYAVWLGKKLNVSPIKADFLIQGYTGRFIKQGISAYQWVHDMVTGNKRPEVFSLNPFIRQWYFESSRNLIEFKSIRDKAQQIKHEHLANRTRPTDAEIDMMRRVDKIDDLMDRLRHFEKTQKPQKDAEQLFQYRREILDEIGMLRSAS